MSFTVGFTKTAVKEDITLEPSQYRHIKEPTDIVPKGPVRTHSKADQMWGRAKRGIKGALSKAPGALKRVAPYAGLAGVGALAGYGVGKDD